MTEGAMVDYGTEQAQVAAAFASVSTYRNVYLHEGGPVHIGFEWGILYI